MAKNTLWVKLVGIAILLFLIGAFLTAPVLAAEFRHGDDVTVGQGEVIDDDLYVAGTTIIIDGIVNGDLVTAGQTIRVNGRVTGSVFAAGQTIIVEGEVGGSLIAAGRMVTVSGSVGHTARMAGETLSISGKVGRDILAAGTSLNIAGPAVIGRDLVFSGSESFLSGSVGRMVKGAGSKVTLAGDIKGDVDIRADALRISPGSRTGGDLVYTSRNEAEIDRDAVVSGAITRKAPKVKAPPDTAARAMKTILGKVLGFVVALLVGIVLLYLMPGPLEQICRAVRRKVWPSLGWGFLALAAAPAAILFVLVMSIVITVLHLPVAIIGIPLSIIAAALLVLAIYLSQVFVGIAIGRELVARKRALDTKGAVVLALAAGLAVLALLRAVPYLGAFVSIATALFGVGAIIASARMGRGSA